MKLRSFTAADMPAVMAMVRAALGDEAIILSSTANRKTREITVTAAIEDDDDLPLPPPVARTAPAPAAPRSGAEILAPNAQSEGWLDELAFLLRYHGIPEALAGRMIYKARSLDLDKLFALQSLSGGGRAPLEAKALTKLIGILFRFSPLSLQPGNRIMLVGPPGVGKTLAIAKLAAYAAIERMAVQVITTDDKRAGGIEQLSAFTEILHVHLKVASNPSELQQAIKTVPPHNLLLIDTAGCNPYNSKEINELNDLIASAKAEPVLTLPAGMDPYEACDTARAFTHTSIARLLVTRADAARRYGGLLAAVDARGLAFAGLSMSARVVGEISTLDAAQLARMLLDSQTQKG